MEEMYTEGLTSHGIPESRMRQFSQGSRSSVGRGMHGKDIELRKRAQTGCRLACHAREATWKEAIWSASFRPRAGEDSWHVRKLHGRETGEPVFSL